MSDKFLCIRKASQTHSGSLLLVLPMIWARMQGIRAGQNLLLSADKDDRLIVEPVKEGTDDPI